MGHVSKIGNGNVYNQPEVVTQRDFSGRNIGFHNEHITLGKRLKPGSMMVLTMPKEGADDWRLRTTPRNTGI